jgi:alpha-glucoside transport system permease protein
VGSADLRPAGVVVPHGDQISTTGWWKSLTTQEQQLSPIRVEGAEVPTDGAFVIEGNLFANAATSVSRWGVNSREPEAFAPGDDGRSGRRRHADGGRGGRLSPDLARHDRRHAPAARLHHGRTPPEFTIRNYETVLLNPLAGQSVGQAFLNTMTVAIPAT